ncbi:hypothetical protein Lpl43_08155 [Lactiplantibacillus plantarum]|uniref:hypothetical protein n=1 Tax=Lactiplantibacillus plantarum TaxID=1590 RepID=UPI00077DF116|nr:hypothetical protein [Lactiplantibacillus plantarum]KYK04579.1 hypothetical protein Lpl43_08155 [Lactiplantibacillus plantarum]
MSDEKMNPLLDRFKLRMKIYHKAEDANLSRILNASQKHITDITGIASNAGDDVYDELVLERARYAYNDQVEFFDANFLDDLLSASLASYEPGDDEDESTEV